MDAPYRTYRQTDIHMHLTWHQPAPPSSDTHISCFFGSSPVPIQERGGGFLRMYQLPAVDQVSQETNAEDSTREEQSANQMGVMVSSFQDKEHLRCGTPRLHSWQERWRLHSGFQVYSILFLSLVRPMVVRPPEKAGELWPTLTELIQPWLASLSEPWTGWESSRVLPLSVHWESLHGLRFTVRYRLFFSWRLHIGIMPDTSFCCRIRPRSHLLSGLLKGSITVDEWVQIGWKNPLIFHEDSSVPLRVVTSCPTWVVL